jgi:hypothetical protein
MQVRLGVPEDREVHPVGIRRRFDRTRRSLEIVDECGRCIAAKRFEVLDVVAVHEEATSRVSPVVVESEEARADPRDRNEEVKAADRARQHDAATVPATCWDAP